MTLPGLLNSISVAVSNNDDLLINYVILFFSFHTGLLMIFLYKLCCCFKLPFSNFEIQEGFAEQIATTMQKVENIYFKQ